MSVPFGPFAFTLDDLTQPLRRTVEPFTDLRQKNTRFTLIALSKNLGPALKALY